MRIWFLTRIMQRKALKKITAVHHGKYVPLKSARMLGFIVNAETSGIADTVSMIKSELSQKGLSYKGICINLGKEPADASFSSDPMVTVIRRRNLTWYGTPRKGIADMFLDSEYDIVIDLTSGKRIFLTEFLLKSTKASLLIGTGQSGKAPYDITVCGKDGSTPAYDLAKNIMNYLKTIN